MIFFVLLLFFALSNAFSTNDLIDVQWNVFKLEHKKNYSGQVEESLRRKIFIENSYKIAKHNQLFELGMVSFELGMNQFGDMLNSEFVSIMNGYNRSSEGKERMLDEVPTFLPPANVELPTSVDWRKKGAVTEIKDQGQCGSCWAFSATGSLEGQHFRQLKKLVSLSEQNLVDCSGKYGNQGCDGGLMDYAFQYIKYNRGIDTETWYPYHARDQQCKYDPKHSGATDKGYKDIQAGSEADLQAAVATVGPISVAIDASASSFQFYKKGVYYEPNCSSQMLDHGVLAVGYGATKDGKNFWIVKNSWGTSWGDDGYILMSRNRNNNCGIATKASYPLV